MPDVYDFDAPAADWNHEPPPAELFDDFGVAVYTTDADGHLIYYNEAAADLWGYRPEVGKTRWCGSWRLFRPNGSVLPPDRCPMAIALKHGRAVRGDQAVLERPDGTLLRVAPFPTALRDSSGKTVGGFNMLMVLASTPMRRTVNRSRGSAALSGSPGASHDLDRLTGCVQWTLAALADVEFEFEGDCERLETWAGAPEEKERILRQLDVKRNKQREPLLRFLAELDRRARVLTARRNFAIVQRSAAGRHHSIS